jgi:hypothetical protein
MVYLPLNVRIVVIKYRIKDIQVQVQYSSIIEFGCYSGIMCTSELISECGAK